MLHAASCGVRADYIAAIGELHLLQPATTTQQITTQNGKNKKKRETKKLHVATCKWSADAAANEATRC